MGDPIGTIGSAIISSDSQRSAADTSADAQLTAAQMQQQNWNTMWNSPYNQAMQTSVGPQALNQLMSTYGQQQQPWNMSTFQGTPAYQSMLGANQLLMQNAPAQYAATGMLGSGNMQSGLQNQAQLNALQSLPTAYQQWMGPMQLQQNSLQSLAGLGQSQNLGMAGVGVNATNAIGQNIAGAGSSLASGQLGQANVWSNAIGNQQYSATGGYGMAMNMYNMLNAQNAGGAGGAGGYDAYNPSNYDAYDAYAAGGGAADTSTMGYSSFYDVAG